MWRRRRALDALERDIHHHIQQDTEENIARGMAPEEARRQALLKFGNVALTREDTRAVWTWAWVEQAVQDGRYAVRILRRQPGFSLTVILTLALGIGMNGVVSSVTSAALLRPLSYPDSERLVWIGARSAFAPNTESALSTDFLVWREQASSFELMTAYDPSSTQALVARGSATQANVSWVTDDFWRLSGGRLSHGRVPKNGERAVVVLSHALFSDRFQGDPAVIDSTVLLNGQPVTIVGVLPDDFVFELPIQTFDGLRQQRRVDAYRSMVLEPQDRMRGQILHVVGRLKPDVSLAQAQTELETIHARIMAQTPLPFLDKYPLGMAPVREKLTGNSRWTLGILLAAVGFVLLIVCTNIAGLLLARWSVRQKEMAVRASLGAGRARLLRQAITEGIVLALAGGAAGLLFADWALGVVVRLTPDAISGLGQSRIDGLVITYSLLISLVTTCLSSIAPAISQWRADVMHFRERSATSRPDQLRSRRLLVATQLALAAVLLTGAALLLKSYVRMHAYPDGFHPDRILSFRVPLSGPRYRDIEQRRQFADALLTRMASANLEAFGLNTGVDFIMIVRKEGAPRPGPGEPRPPGAAVNAASAGGAATMGLRILSGRWITDREPNPVVVINERLRRRDFAGEDPVGQAIFIPGAPGAPDVLATIVGVVSDVKYSKLDDAPGADLYVPYRHHPLLGFTVLSRVAGDPRSSVPALREILADIDATQPMFDVTTLEQSLADSIAPRRFNLLLFGTFAATAVILALIGVYGVVAYLVTRRTQEIGIRLALGAERKSVVGMVIRQGLGMTIGGLAIGVVAAMVLTRMMERLLYEVEPTDPATFTIVAVALAVAALTACAWPAMKAARVDPLTALRLEP
jgi:predicted permease